MTKIGAALAAALLLALAGCNETTMGPQRTGAALHAPQRAKAAVYRYRDKATGRFVSARHARANPGTTAREAVKRR